MRSIPKVYRNPRVWSCIACGHTLAQRTTGGLEILRMGNEYCDAPLEEVPGGMAAFCETADEPSQFRTDN